MRERLADRRGWGLAIAAGLLLRAIFAWKHPSFDGDTAVYGDLARNLLTHHIYGLTEATIRPTLIRLPGYPLFLTACFAAWGIGRYVPVLCIQIVLALASCWMLALLAERRLGSREARVVIWLACLCPFTAEFDAIALTESLSLVCVIAALFALDRWLATPRWRWALMLGFACAWAVLLRPDEGLLAAAMIPAMFFGSRRRVSGALLASLLVALPLAAWTVRNGRTMHVLQPLAPKYANDPGEFVSYGFNRWYRSWGVEYLSTVNTYWLWDGSSISMADLPARAIDTEPQREQTAQAYAAYNAVTSSTPEIDAMFGQLAAQRAKAHPFRTYIAMPAGRFLDMWLRPRTEFFKLPLAWWHFWEHPVGSLLCIAWGAIDWLLLTLALLGVRAWRWDALGWAAVGFVLLRCALLLTIDNSEPRYTLVCFPVIFLLAGARNLVKLWKPVEIAQTIETKREISQK